MMDQPFMMWSGRRVEWQMLHPEFKSIFGFIVHGADVCRMLDIHPMFPVSGEIEQVRNEIESRESALF